MLGDGHRRSELMRIGLFIGPVASWIFPRMQAMPSWNDELTHAIISCALHVHNTLGPGFHERIYCRALRIELQKRGFAVELETHIPIRYDGKLIGSHRLDMLIQNSVIVEAKNVDALTRVHYAQARSYLEATGLRRALLVNFAGERVDIRRIQNPITKRK